MRRDLALFSTPTTAFGLCGAHTGPPGAPLVLLRHRRVRERLPLPGEKDVGGVRVRERCGDLGVVGRLLLLPDAPAQQRRLVLRSLPQVGPAAAEKLLSRFGTVARAMSASQSELQDAIGPKLGLRVFELLNTSMRS